MVCAPRRWCAIAAGVASTNGKQGEHVPGPSHEASSGDPIRRTTAQASDAANASGPATGSQAFAQGDLPLRAPRTGVLLEACARKGDFVRAGQPLVVLRADRSEQQDGAAAQAAANLTHRRNALLNERRPLREPHAEQRRMELAQIDRALAALAQDSIDTGCGDKLVITAPQAGVITACPVNVGQQVQDGQVLVTLAPHARPTADTGEPELPQTNPRQRHSCSQPP